MGDHQVQGFKPFVLEGELQDLKPVHDEIYLDLQDGTGTVACQGWSRTKPPGLREGRCPIL